MDQPRHRRPAADADAAGYLPLLAPELTAERLERAGLLISIAPAREFSDRERGTRSISSSPAAGRSSAWSGAEDARASAPLLAEFNFTVPASPVPPGKEAREPEPLGFVEQMFGEGQRQPICPVLRRLAAGVRRFQPARMGCLVERAERPPDRREPLRARRGRGRDRRYPLRQQREPGDGREFGSR